MWYYNFKYYKRIQFKKSTVYNIINLYKNTGNIKLSTRSGRPKLLNDRDKRHLLRLVKKDRKSTINILQNEFLQSISINASTRTLQRYLHEEGFYARVGKRKPFVSKKNKKIRFEWAKERLHWTSEWNSIIWSDESRFEVYGGDGRNYVWRLPKEKYDVNCLKPTFNSGRRGVMVWGCFIANGLGPLVRINGK